MKNDIKKIGVVNWEDVAQIELEESNWEALSFWDGGATEEGEEEVEEGGG